VQNREQNVERKLDLLDKKEKNLQAFEKDVESRQTRVAEKELEQERLIAEYTKSLEELSGVSKEEAKQFLHEKLLDQVKIESAQMLKDVRDSAKLEARKEAQKVIIQAIQRTAAEL